MHRDENYRVVVRYLESSDGRRVGTSRRGSGIIRTFDTPANFLQPNALSARTDCDISVHNA